MFIFRTAAAISNASSFSVLLLQGLHTNDLNLINDVLSKKVDEKIMQNTVQRLPSGVIIEFLNTVSLST